MSISSPIRIGVIGAGTIGKIHMKHFGELPGVEIAAVQDVTSALAQNAASEHGVGRVYDKADELFSDEKIDAVVIGVPNKWHAELAIAALRAGKHVLLEKPMALNVEDAREIVRVQKETGRVLMVGHQMRWGWWARQAKERVEAGDLGEILYAKCGWLRRKGIPGWGTWFTQKAVAGGGPLIDVGVHLLDLTLWLMGDPRPVSVFGSTYAAFGPEKRGIGTWATPDFEKGIFDVEDLATALVKFDNGATLSLEVSWAVNKDTDSQPFVHLLGKQGGISVQHGRHKFLSEVEDKPTEEDFVKPADDEGERTRLAKHFVECVREGREPISPALSGLKNNMILDAIYRSSETGREVLLDFPEA